MNRFLNEFEEIWLDEPEIEIYLTGVKLGKGGPEFNLLDKVIVNNFHNDFYKNINNKIGYIIDYFDYDNTYLIYFIEKVSERDTPARCKKYKGKAAVQNEYTLWLLSKFLKKI